MKTDFCFESCGGSSIRASRWMPEVGPKAVVQIVHGIAEHIDRYDPFAAYLNSQGIVVIAEDHMGHGKSIGSGPIGYFRGGWFNAVEDTYHLLQDTREKYPALPYILLGHSMGSFMARTILIDHPYSGIDACILTGTGWQPTILLPVAIAVCKQVCKTNGEDQPSPKLQNLVFGSYNARVEHKRTSFDWLTRNERLVDAYIADPLCGFIATGGLLRDMMEGIFYIEQNANLKKMNSKHPILFVSGKDDPVGNYGKGVKATADAFRKAGVADVDCKLYPLGRHEILNELNCHEVFQDISHWIFSKTK